LSAFNSEYGKRAAFRTKCLQEGGFMESVSFGHEKAPALFLRGHMSSAFRFELKIPFSRDLILLRLFKAA
jgi:hypothetical protein